ncbi:MAG: Rhomboid family protein [Verrucomicrobia bacterium]|jgi:membrane associated rhomboid family serine protease|nr:Rhomboid family protein [Verrucomicrobiota bacterium]
MTNVSPVLIPTKDRKQAMDWSLVLVSQGIETSIVQIGEERFALEVAGKDSVRAFQTLKLYHKETRGWDWWLTPAVEGPRFEPLALLWVVALVFWHGLADKGPLLISAGAMDSERFALGEWWRLFTAVTLHHDLAHLAANCTIGLVLFGLAAARYGLGVSLLAAYLAGVLGNVAGWMIYDPPYRSLGASGMVMGALGLLIARPSIGEGLPSLKRKRLMIAASAGVMLFMLLGANPQSDMVAHLGGFAAGLLFGWMIRRSVLKENSAWNQQIALGAFILLLLLTWGRALR